MKVINYCLGLVRKRSIIPGIVYDTIYTFDDVTIAADNVSREIA